jgi:hypothetical protein
VVAARSREAAVVADPVLIALVAACARGLVRLAETLADWIAIRARIELARIAAAAPPGTEVVEQDRRGGTWQFRSQSRDEPRG